MKKDGDGAQCEGPGFNALYCIQKKKKKGGGGVGDRREGEGREGKGEGGGRITDQKTRKAKESKWKKQQRGEEIQKHLGEKRGVRMPHPPIPIGPSASLSLSWFSLASQGSGWVLATYLRHWSTCRRLREPALQSHS